MEDNGEIRLAARRLELAPLPRRRSKFADLSEKNGVAWLQWLYPAAAIGLVHPSIHLARPTA